MDVRVRTLAQLCREGYSDRIVLSHDVTCYADWFPKSLGGGTLKDWTLTHVSDTVVPALLDAGVTGEQVDQMLVGNPRHILERREPY
jgi:phosphotriesterase-related protein